MIIPHDLAASIIYARGHALEGMKTRPFDPVYRYALDQITIVERELADHGDLSGLRSEEINVGRMAAKELGNDERDYAHALSVIQWYADKATGDNNENM